MSNRSIVDSKCSLAVFRISPQDRPEDSDHMTCYTKRRGENHILKATATSSDFSASPSVLTKGIFNLDYSTTAAYLKGGSNPYP